MRHRSFWQKKVGASARIIAANSLSTSVTSTDAFLIVAKTSSRSSSARSLLRILIMDIWQVLSRLRSFFVFCKRLSATDSSSLLLSMQASFPRQFGINVDEWTVGKEEERKDEWPVGNNSAYMTIMHYCLCAIVVNIIFSAPSNTLVILFLAFHSVRSLTKWLFGVEKIMRVFCKLA